MSVVNTMLRELADRQQQEPLGVSVHSAPAASTRWPWWFVAIAVVAILVFFGRWQRATEPATAQQPTTTTSQTTNPVVATTVNSAAQSQLDTATPQTVVKQSSTAASIGQLPATASTMTTATTTTGALNANRKPASIGWELVAREEQTFRETLPLTSDGDSAELGPDSAAASVSTPATTSSFERQPAQLSVTEQLTLLRQQARNAIAAGDWRGAEQAIVQRRQLAVDDAELAVLQLQATALHDPAAASQQAQAQLLAAPGNWSVRQWLGTQQLQQKQFAAARSTLSEQAPTLSAAPDYHSVLALAEQQDGAHDVAAAHYRSLLALQPEHGRHHAGLALSLEPLGDIAGASNAWFAALRDPQLPAPLAQYGRQRLQQLARLPAASGQHALTKVEP